MTAKLVSIRTRSGDDLTPVPSCYHVQTISQRQAILAFRNNSKSTIWPAVKARMSDASIRATQPRIRISAAWIRAILLVDAMKNCTSCKYARWKLDYMGNPHSSGDGKCEFTYSFPPIPISWHLKGSPYLSGGNINKNREFRDHCPCYEAKK